MTSEHILQSCPTHAAVRDKIWPTPTALDVKLNSTLEDLRRTADFIRDAGVDI